MTSTRPPITPEYLKKNGRPIVISPSEGIIAIISGDGYETVDLLPEHVEGLVQGLVDWERFLGRESA